MQLDTLDSLMDLVDLLTFASDLVDRHKRHKRHKKHKRHGKKHGGKKNSSAKKSSPAKKSSAKKSSAKKSSSGSSGESSSESSGESSGESSDFLTTIISDLVDHHRHHRHRRHGKKGKNSGSGSNSKSSGGRSGARFNLEKFQQMALQKHNELRALHKDTPPMVLDKKLCAGATAYARKLAAGKAHGHSRIHGLGENLWKKIGKDYGDAQHVPTNVGAHATQCWYNEQKNYNFKTGSLQNKDTSYKSGIAGHFTQVVWDTSVKLGIGMAYNEKTKTTYVVGRYVAPGNLHIRPNYTKHMRKGSAAFKKQYQKNWTQAFTTHVHPLKDPSKSGWTAPKHHHHHHHKK